MKTRAMPDSSSSSALQLKHEFLKKWIKGLQIYNNFKKNMTVFERKRAIKLSADVAIASTRSVATHWSRAVMANVSTDPSNEASKKVVEKILGGARVVENKAFAMTCSNKILRRSHERIKARRIVPPRPVSVAKASSIAKKLVKNRTRVLKKLVPGGQQMDEVCLIKETLDYIASLKVQVDVMRHLAAAAGRLEPPQSSSL